MRIARVLTRLNLGGPARQVLACDPVLLRKGHSVRVFAGSPEEGEGALDSALREAGVDVVHVPGLARPFRAAFDGRDRRARRFLERELAAFDPEVVHTHASKAGALGRRAALRATPSAARVHTFHGHVLDGYFPAPVSFVLRRLERGLASRTDAVIAVSEATRADLARFGVAREDGIDVVPPGVDLGELLDLPVERDRARLRRELGVPIGGTLVVCLGRLAPVKRPRLALQVFERIAGEFPDAHLAFVGDGDEAPALRADLAGLGSDVRERVHLLGALESVQPVHEALDVLLSTSVSEGMPVAMIEAAAAARPVVSTAVGGVPELVRSGVTGLFGTDVDGLAAALGGLLADADKRDGFGRAARERVATRHTGEALASKLEAIYRRVLTSRA